MAAYQKLLKVGFAPFVARPFYRIRPALQFLLDATAEVKSIPWKRMREAAHLPRSKNRPQAPIYISEVSAANLLLPPRSGVIAEKGTQSQSKVGWGGFEPCFRPFELPALRGGGGGNNNIENFFRVWRTSANHLLGVWVVKPCPMIPEEHHLLFYHPLWDATRG